MSSVCQQCDKCLTYEVYGNTCFQTGNELCKGQNKKKWHGYNMWKKKKIKNKNTVKPEVKFLGDFVSTDLRLSFQHWLTQSNKEAEKNGTQKV